MSEATGSARLDAGRLSIALLGRYFLWGGGQDFLHLIASGLAAKKQEADLSLHLLLPRDNLIETPLDLLRVAKRSAVMTKTQGRLRIARPANVCDRSYVDGLSDLAEKVQIVHYNNTRGGLLRGLRRLGADVALPVSGSLGTRFPIPWVGYIYDFQHRHYPQYFAESERRGRDDHFALMAREAMAIIVNSKAVKRDFRLFYPDSRAEVVALPFSPVARKQWFEPHAKDVVEKYSLPPKYFLISNQFWVHKDHFTAFRALAALVDDPDVHIICTGSLEDCRRPEYPQEVRNFLATHKLTKRVQLLGHIPKRDQIEIMNGAIAVIQPTLFEGGPGGGCVYDAVALGVPVILSDIEVNREVDSGEMSWFKAGDPLDLATKMEVALHIPPKRPSQETLRERSKERAQRLGDTLLELVQHVVSAGPRRGIG